MPNKKVLLLILSVLFVMAVLLGIILGQLSNVDSCCCGAQQASFKLNGICTSSYTPNAIPNNWSYQKILAPEALSLFAFGVFLVFYLKNRK